MSSKGQSLLRIITTLAMVITPTVFAQGTNAKELVLIPSFDPSTAVVIGTTGGTYSFSAIANQDHNGNACIGYGDINPDHTLTLEQNFSQLTLAVNSRGRDTTLVIKRPDGKIYCDFGSRSQSDAVITAENWKTGEYQVWVGSINANQRINYSLSASEE